MTAGVSGDASLSQIQVFTFSLIVAGSMFYLWLRSGLLVGLCKDLLALIGISAVGAATAPRARPMAMPPRPGRRRSATWRASARPGGL